MLAAACMLLFTCTQYQLILPSLSRPFCGTARHTRVATMVPSGSFQIRSASARCLGLVTTMSAGRRCENVPTSRAVPHADGCPVSEKGLLPGVEILPVRRCRLYRRLLHQTPRVCWLKPMVKKDVTFTLGSA